MSEELRWLLTAVLFPIGVGGFWFLRSEIKEAHKRVSRVREEHSAFQLEVTKAYATKDHLTEYIVKPITERLVSIERKIDRANGRP